MALLTTKFFPPPIHPGLLERADLIQSLENGRQQGGRLSLICAPAGYGKSTLASSYLHWLAGRASPTAITSAWLSLDEEDNEPILFLTYLAACLQAATSQGSALALANSVPPPAPQAITTALLNDLAAIAGPVILVLDDYQVIRHPEIHQQVAYFIDHLSPAVHLILATRSDPPLPLHRYRSRGQMVELRAEDLRFQQTEAHFLFKRISGQILKAEESEILCARTEGWAAGIQMAALSVRGKPDASAFIRSLAGTNRYILDYLTEEALNNQPASIQDFLIQTAVLERLCPPLCDAVMAVPGFAAEDPSASSQEILNMLEQTNLFLIPLDDSRYWRRYHHLFLDLLRIRLQQREQKFPGLIQSLHRRAAAWFEAQGWQAEAIHHSIQAADFVKAAELVEQHTTSLFAQGELHRLLAWISLLPAETADRPWLGIYKGWALVFAGRLSEMEAALKPARLAVTQGFGSPADLAALQAELLAQDAMIAVSSGNSARALSLIDRPLDDFPAGRTFARGAIHWALGYALRMQGNPARAIAEFRAMLRIGQETDNIWTVATACVDLGMALRLTGRLDEAEAVYRQGLQAVQRVEGHGLGFAGRLESFLANLMYEKNELAEAYQLVQASISHNRLWENPNHTAHAYWILARVLLGKSELDAAAEALTQAEKITETAVVVPALKNGIVSTRIRYWITRNQLEPILRWLADHPLPANLEKLPADEAGELELLTSARCLMVVGKQTVAYLLLQQLKQTAHSHQRVNSWIEIGCLQALCAPDRAAAFAILAEVVQLGAPSGYRRVFIDEGLPLSALLEQCLAETKKRETQRSAAAALSTAFELILAAFPAVAHPLTAPAEGPLTPRELEILNGIAEGLSNQEIGLRLYISAGTVKAHSSAIYRKLDVKNRSQAIAKAKTNGLI